MKNRSSTVLFPAEAEKISRPNSSRDTLAIRAIRSAVRRSRSVQVGDLNMTVSERMAAAIMPAIFSEGHQAPVLEHTGNNRIGGAYRLVADVNRPGGLDVGQPVVVDNFQDFRFFQTGDGLGSLVVIHQHHPLAPRLEQMIPGQHADNLFVLVQDGIAGGTVLQNLARPRPPGPPSGSTPGRRSGNAADGRRLEQQPGGPIGVIGRGNNAGIGGELVPEILPSSAWQSTRVFTFMRKARWIISG